MDITEVILSDHHEQRRMFGILEEIDPERTDALGSIWGRLQVLLEVHAKAEELYFYPRLLQLQKDRIEKESPEDETEDAIHDHNEIRDAISGVGGKAVGSDSWFRAVAEVNEVNSDHMGEEERQGLTDFRRHVSREERHTIAVDFCAFEAEHAAGIDAHDEDPKEYVASHE
jgi:hypothetical protein